MNSASARASSVLPTPVGPRKRKVPIGRFGSASPARERRRALATASTASSWPITRSCRRSSMWISFSTSPSIRRETGIPVHLPTTSATSCSVTSSVSIEPPSACSVREALLLLGERLLELGDRARSGARPRCSRSARARRARPRGGPPRGSRLAALIASIAPFSACQRAFISDASSRCSSGELGLERLAAAPSRPRRTPCFSACCSISSCWMRRSTSSISTGEDSISIFSREAASSIRSIALSGRKRSAM